MQPMLSLGVLLLGLCLVFALVQRELEALTPKPAWLEKALAPTHSEQRHPDTLDDMLKQSQHKLYALSEMER